MLDGKVIKEGWESQVLPCLPEVVNETTQIKVNGSNIGLCPMDTA